MRIKNCIIYLYLYAISYCGYSRYVYVVLYTNRSGHLNRHKPFVSKNKKNIFIIEFKIK